jgi:hypothetical protein
MGEIGLHNTIKGAGRIKQEVEALHLLFIDGQAASGK